MPDENEEKLMRGSAINGYLKFVKKKWGVVGLNDCLASTRIGGLLKDGQYYPKEIRLNILEWIAKEHGMEFVREGGKHTVLNLGLLSWLMRFAKPHAVALRMKENYPEVYKYGKIVVDVSHEKKVIVRFYDNLETETEHVAWLGVGEGFLEGTKTKGKVTMTKSVVNGDEYAEYIVDIE